MLLFGKSLETFGRVIDQRAGQIRDVDEPEAPQPRLEV